MKSSSPCCFYLMALLVFAVEVSASAWIDGNKGWLDNGVMKLGIDSTYGGAIVYVSSSGSSTNLVNIYDYGRLIQQSYYAGQILDRQSEGQLPNWTPWPWNPVQGGNGAGGASLTLSFAAMNDGTTLYSECQPRLWDMNGEMAQATMQQWMQFEPGMNNVVRVDNRLLCWRDAGDIWGGPVLRHQECPAVYLIRDMGKVMMYDGPAPWQNSPLTVITSHAGPPWQMHNPTENWAACVYPGNDFGVGIYSTYGDQFWYIGSAGSAGGGAASASTMHMAAITAKSLDRTALWDYTYWIILGDVAAIRSRAYELHDNGLPPLPAYTWIGTQAGANWENPANWSPTGLPSYVDNTINAYINTLPGPTLYSGSAGAWTLGVANHEGNAASLDIRGGTLKARGLDAANHVNSTATVNVYDGTHETWYLCPGFRGHGTINMYGGTIRVNTEIRIAHNGTGSTGILNLYGGTISGVNLGMSRQGGTASIWVRDGLLLLDGNKVSTVQGFLNNGWITAADGYQLVVEYDGVLYPGKTALYALYREYNHADINRDGQVDMEDLAVMSSQWLDVPSTPSADIAPRPDLDGRVGLLDLLMLTEDWLLE